MATPTKKSLANLNPFKKGQSGNPSGRPKLPPHLLKIKPYMHEEIERTIAKYMRLEKGKLQKILKEESDKLPMFEAMVCSILANAYKSGDYSKVEFLLSRTVGKARDKKDEDALNANGEPPQKVVVYLPSNEKEVPQK